MRHLICTVGFFMITSYFLVAQDHASVSFEKYLSLKQAGGPIVSPDGKNVLYSISSTDWDANAYDNEIWLSRNGAPGFQLTRTNKGSSFAARFSPDGQWISFMADRGDKTQLYIMSVNGGEAFPITKEETGISTYDWQPDSKGIAFTKPEPESGKDKNMAARYGGFTVEGTAYTQNHLWIIAFDIDSINNFGKLPCYSQKTDTGASKKACPVFLHANRLTEGNFTVTGFAFSPDGKMIAFNRQPDPMINSSIHSDIYLLEPSTKKITPLVENKSSDAIEAWSPDSRSFLFSTQLDDTTSQFYKNGHVFMYDLQTKKSQEILKGFDEQINIVDWNGEGIWFTASQKMKINLFHLDPKTGSVTTSNTAVDIIGGVSFSKSGRDMAWSGRKFDGMNEIFKQAAGEPAQQLTHQTNQLQDWNTPVNEIISWKSKDGFQIEGVLSKPRNFDPSKKYPLLCVIHGGPTGTDRPDPVATYVYPIMQWVEKGALVLRVNYRGSAGYGEKFRSLNLRNLGVGDMWDVISGVEYLQKQGSVDTSRMGCMGWSQGGYISAFLTTNTHIFKAISVGAGISNWVTYYVSTDITPFTREYLQATPWNDRAIYEKTSPMTHINNASTPTLIQHGEFDKRVPISDAYELYRGLQDRGIPSKLIVYKGFGHGISKPKERLAAIWHNWEWFNHYVFGEILGELPFEK